MNIGTYSCRSVKMLAKEEVIFIFLLIRSSDYFGFGPIFISTTFKGVKQDSSLRTQRNLPFDTLRDLELWACLTKC